MSNQADVKSGPEEAAASFMRARRPVFGIAYSMLCSASEASESENLAGNGNFPYLREVVPRRCTHIFAGSDGYCTSCRWQTACMMCGKTTSGLVKRVCAQCRQTQKR